jgi:hypothetical protein
MKKVRSNDRSRGQRRKQIGLEELHGHAVRDRDPTLRANRLFGNVQGEVVAGNQTRQRNGERAGLSRAEFEDPMSRLQSPSQIIEQNQGCARRKGDASGARYA